MDIEACWDIINDYLSRQYLPIHVDQAVKRINLEILTRDASTDPVTGEEVDVDTLGQGNA